MFRFHKPSAEVPVVEWTVSNRTVIRVLALVIVSTLLLTALHAAGHALVLIFTAFFLALALNAPVHWVGQHLPGKLRGRRALATSLAFLIVILALAGFITAVGPSLVRQTSSFISAAPHLVEQTRDQQNSLGKFIRNHHLEDQVNTISKQLSGRLGSIGSSAVSSLTKIGSSVFSILVVLALTFMMLNEGPHWLKFIDELIPPEHRKDVRRLATDMYRVVKGFVNGQVTLAAIAACLLLPGLLILHVSFPVALVVVVFICGLIPMVGHTLGAIIVTTVALATSVTSAVAILAYYILYQQIENYVIQPQIQANSTNLSPLLVFTSVVIGVSFGGLLGGLVSIPIMGCARILTLDYLQRRGMLRAAKAEATATSDAR